MGRKKQLQWGILCLLVLGLVQHRFQPLVEGREIIIETEGRIAAIGTEERTVMETLLAMEEEIQAVALEAERIAGRVNTLKGEVEDLDGKVEREQESFRRNRETLQAVVQIYQKNGPGTFLEILLDSEDLTSFLRRVNILRDLLRNTGILMERLEESAALLEQMREGIAGRLALVEQEQARLRETLREKVALKEEREAYLASLEEQRYAYEAYLAEVRYAWEEVKPLFVLASAGFSRAVAAGSLPEEALEIEASFASITVRIREEVLNQLILDRPELPELAFGFEEERVRVSAVGETLVLKGRFVLAGENRLEYRAEEGTFLNLPLGEAALGELFAAGPLELDLAPLADGNRVTAVESVPGMMLLKVRPSWLE
ncbi:coiled-coil domain-containing protein [Anaerotalea alkaliphila]|uniref:Uncharacterized protein n=1 Tax=Anaerotalea alkaliphila TaxID=2662126 RepID=A0A7X5HX23_9FIRM|nr:hypothetical protein [Anaerotalea alkaliphila]NDL68255.1 hypothetical protein [Anaerotalea alkaliphila]